MGACALVGAVEFNAEHFSAQRFDAVIAVDAGYAHLEKIKVEPDLVVGDFDSLGYVPDHPRIETHPSHKDASDIELAMQRAAELGFDTLVVYGCLSGRLDHTYGTLQLLARFARRGLRAFAVGDTFAVCALEGGAYNALEFDAVEAGTLSAFAVSDTVRGVDEIGLEYPLDKAVLVNDEPLGVSNEFIGKPVKVAIEEGTLLVFFPLHAWNSMRSTV
ncbi:thiamine diphosphokinase [Raoultibacter phocaeensis]|uniref:thiamine diphosphokinase n=1 Tax=Raoultibacter phocaeensis TaxID=2479841 RepID=UPI001119F94D|nr:thiamine diphosphokinase [Raoultibacter phocaeensis]